MSGQHTQGPWAVTHDTDIIGTENDPENGCVGTVDVAHVYLRTVPGRTAANARLIASAPDLLAALNGLLAYFESGNSVATGRATIKTDSLEVRAAYAAIAKATGVRYEQHGK